MKENVFTILISNQEPIVVIIKEELQSSCYFYEIWIYWLVQLYWHLAILLLLSVSTRKVLLVFHHLWKRSYDISKICSWLEVWVLLLDKELVLSFKLVIEFWDSEICLAVIFGTQSHPWATRFWSFFYKWNAIQIKLWRWLIFRPNVYVVRSLLSAAAYRLETTIILF